MGLFFRKSLKLGPVRLNFSKSGIGVSTGVRGLRVSTSARGTYLNAGREVFITARRWAAGRASAAAAHSC